MTCLNAHSAMSRNINRHWRCTLDLNREVLSMGNPLLDFYWMFLEGKT